MERGIRDGVKILNTAQLFFIEPPEGGCSPLNNESNPREIGRALVVAPTDAKIVRPLTGGTTRRGRRRRGDNLSNWLRGKCSLWEIGSVNNKAGFTLLFYTQSLPAKANATLRPFEAPQAISLSIPGILQPSPEDVLLLPRGGLRADVLPRRRLRLTLKPGQPRALVALASGAIASS